MRLLNELADQLMLGTERRPPVLPVLPEPLADLLGHPPAGDETGLLRAAGAIALCADAGYLPEPEPSAPAALAPDTGPLAGAALVPLLGDILDDGPEPLRIEAMTLLAGAGLVLPPRLLPRALSLAARTSTLHPALALVLGTRGRWLAGLNPDWAAAASAGDALDDDLWQHGSAAQRQAYLAALRARDPDRARSLAQADFAGLDARERAALLDLLAVALGPADEAFLQATLADRSKEVRLVAAGLLAQLPGSAYLERMTARLAPCLRQERKLFRQVWLVEPPAAFGPDWKADAVEEQRPKHDALGERAWWLYQLARALPLSWWTERTGMTPAQATKWAMDSDWSEALFRAWGEALTRRPDPDWATAFLGHGRLPGLTPGPAELLACLPPGDRERYWLDALRQRHGDVSRGELLAHVLREAATMPGTMSAEFARRVLDEVRATLILPNHVGSLYALCQALPEFACRLPTSCLDETGRRWPDAAGGGEFVAQALARLHTIVARRQTLYRLISERKSP